MVNYKNVNKFREYFTNYEINKGFRQENENNDQNLVRAICRKFIGLDGFFLKGVCKDLYLFQLLKMETIKYFQKLGLFMK